MNHKRLNKDQPLVEKCVDILLRAKETNKSWFRSDRVFSVGMVWFIETREGIDIGPYNSKKEAQRQIEAVVRMVATLEVVSHREVSSLRDNPATRTRSAGTKVIPI